MWAGRAQAHGGGKTKSVTIKKVAVLFTFFLATLFVCRRRAHVLTVLTRTGEASVLVVPSMHRHSALWGLTTHENGGERAVLARAYKISWLTFEIFRKL